MPACPDPTCDAGWTVGRIVLGRLVGLILCAGRETRRSNHKTLYLDRALSDLMNVEDILKAKDLAEVSTGLAGRPPSEFVGHDAMDRHAATKKIIAAAGLDPESWGICKTCKGSGETT